MSSIKKWEDKIKTIRYRTNFRDYIMEIASWIPVVLYKDELWVSRYSKTDRIINKLKIKDYYEVIDDFTHIWYKYNYEKSFYDNLFSLFRLLPIPSLIQVWTNESCEYSDSVLDCKNVYLSFIIINTCENILYTFYSQDNCKDVLNSVMVWDNSQIVYYSTAVLNSYKVFYSRYIVDSNNIRFSSNLIWCSECVFCDNLQNKKYCINNVEFDREKYFQEKENILKEKNKFEDYYEAVNKTANNIASKNISWNFCVKSENVENWYFTYNLKNWKNAIFVWDKNWRENIVDVICSDNPWSRDLYACSNVWTLVNWYFCDALEWQNMYYCFMCMWCSYCFWCTWLLNKSYFIFNKEYSKEEWFIEVDKLFSIIDSEWDLWKFFPWRYNPFYFNDTLAYLIDDTFTKQEVETEWYLWRDERIKIDIPDWLEIVSAENVGDEDICSLQDFQWYDSNGNWKIDKNILNKVIVDEKWDYYKIVKLEYDFLIKYGLPLPRKHWLDRIREGLKSE